MHVQKGGQTLFSPLCERYTHVHTPNIDFIKLQLLKINASCVNAEVKRKFQARQVSPTHWEKKAHSENLWWRQ